MKSIVLNNDTYNLERAKKKLTSPLPNWERDIFLFLVDWFSNTYTIQVQTSGSTGTPKLIERSKEAMINSALMTGTYLSLNSEDTALLCLPAKYIAGKMMIVRSIVWGLKLDYLKPQNILPSFDKKYSFGAMTPSQANANLSQIHLIQNLIIGGAPISPKLEQELSTQTTSSIYSSYGMTETVSHIALRRIKSPFNMEYMILPDVRVEIDNRNCLIIHAPKLHKHPITTNDIVQIKSSKSFIWKGRYDHIINSGGIKISPEILEQKLTQYISLPFFVSGIQDEKWGARVVLIIEGNSFDTTQLEFTINLNLEKHEIPKYIYFLSQFVYTTNGKLNRKETFKLLSFQGK
jgi:O-succinylbenzoic acid--CoA ligase